MSRPTRTALTGVASALIAAGTIALPSAPATAVSADVVISEVYGGGGNSGATYRNDFVELHNTGSVPVSVDGWTVQYASATGTSWQRTPLTGTIAPGQRYLVQEAKGSGGTADLPTPDAVGTIAMSGSNGKVALVQSGTALSGCYPACATAAGVKDFVGYGTANEYEGPGAAPGLDNTTAAARRGTDTDDNQLNFITRDPSPVSSTGGEEPPPPPPPLEGLQIHDVQGAAHLSPVAGQSVARVPGVVTATKSDGFWMQSETPDDDVATSEGVFVYRPSSTPAVGTRVTVTGDVTEFRPGGATGTNLTTTEIAGSPLVTVVGTAPAQPATTIVGPGGRVPPTAVIDDDATGSVETSGSFDATTDGIDFWESLEGMVAGIEQARVVGPTSRFGETPVVPAGATQHTARGGVYVSADDFNPERILVDDLLSAPATATTGDSLAGTTVGVVDYGFANFKLQPWTTPTVVPGGLQRETTTAAGAKEFSLASYNVENLDALDPQEKFDALAAQIVGNLQAPDVVGLEEVQDNDGPVMSGSSAADQTLDRLVAAIAAAGGPTYDWRQIDPVYNAEGGEPGGNIRVAFLFRTDRGVQFVDRGEATSTTPASVYTDADGDAHLTTSPARVAPDSPAWDGSRVPLVGEFVWNDRTFFVVANHFGSKGGDDPLFGRWQPAERSSEVKRHQQAREVRAFVDELLAADKNSRVAVLGDINDFQFSETVDILVGSGEGALTDLPRTLPADEQYTYVYEGNSQVLDHILLSSRFVRDTYAYDIVHVNAEFNDQISDHDPQVVRLGNPNQFKR